MLKYALTLTSTILGSILVTSTASSSEETMKVFTGAEGRGYSNFTTTVVNRMKDYDFEQENLSGSMEIAQSICDHDGFSFGPAQLDAIYTLREDCDFQILGEYSNQEYAMILFPEDSRYNELSDLNGDSKIATDTFGSGTYLFAQTIKKIETEHGNGSSWSDAKTVEVLDTLLTAEAKAGNIDAAILVTSNDSSEIRELFKEGWTLGELYDKDINDLEFNGSPLYKHETVDFEIPGWGNDQSNDAYVVKTFIIARKDQVNANQKLVRTLSRALKQ